MHSNKTLMQPYRRTDTEPEKGKRGLDCVLFVRGARSIVGIINGEVATPCLRKGKMFTVKEKTRKGWLRYTRDHRGSEFKMPERFEHRSAMSFESAQECHGADKVEESVEQGRELSSLAYSDSPLLLLPEGLVVVVAYDQA